MMIEFRADHVACRMSLRGRGGKSGAGKAKECTPTATTMSRDCHPLQYFSAWMLWLGHWPEL